MSGALEGQVALVVGGTKGIGRSITTEFLREGAEVVVGARSQPAEPGSSDPKSYKDKSYSFIAADVSSAEGAQTLIRRTIESHGRIDILVHNAGYVGAGPFGSTAEYDVDMMFRTNIKAAIWLTKAALPSLLTSEGGGRVLVTSSVSGNHANAVGLVEYSASKAAVTGFVRNLALELGPTGITVNAIEPGFIMSEEDPDDETLERYRWTATKVPMLRCGAPEEISRAMVFLASKDAGYITGQSIVVDGGLTLTNSAVASFEPAD